MCPLSSLYIYVCIYIYNDEREREAFIWHSNGCETAWLILCSRFCKIISPKAKSAASGFPSRQQLTFTVLFCRHMLLLNHEGCKLPFWICFPNYEMNIFIFRKIRINLNTLQFPGAIIWTKNFKPSWFSDHIKNIYIYIQIALPTKKCMNICCKIQVLAHLSKTVPRWAESKLKYLKAIKLNVRFCWRVYFLKYWYLTSLCYFPLTSYLPLTAYIVLPKRMIR